MKKCNWPNLIFNWFFWRSQTAAVGSQCHHSWERARAFPECIRLYLLQKKIWRSKVVFFCYGFDLDMHEREVFL